MISGMISAVSISVCAMEISKSMARLWARIRRVGSRQSEDYYYGL